MPSRNSSTLSIALQAFFDFDLDLSGWYAIGHHDQTAFFEAVKAHDPNAHFSRREVQQGWAEFREGGFDFVTRSLPGFQPITVIAQSGNRLID